jgi:hypothetical protein
VTFGFALVLGGLFLVLDIALIYLIPVRRWFHHWGSTPGDILRVMPGDDFVPHLIYDTTLAVTIGAPPADIWPWLVQMGYRRGGLYSYDWLDRLFGFLDAKSATRILPEFQRLTAGDVIPVGRGLDFPVTAVTPDRSLVLSGEQDGICWTWQFGLYPLNAHATRLVSRNRVRGPQTLASRLFVLAIEPAAFVMTRKMLLNLKRRAEALARHRRRDSHAARIAA